MGKTYLDEECGGGEEEEWGDHGRDAGERKCGRALDQGRAASPGAELGRRDRRKSQRKRHAVKHLCHFERVSHDKEAQHIEITVENKSHTNPAREIKENGQYFSIILAFLSPSSWSFARGGAKESQRSRQE